jgi:hypothetical protein
MVQRQQNGKYEQFDQVSGLPNHVNQVGVQSDNRRDLNDRPTLAMHASNSIYRALAHKAGSHLAVCATAICSCTCLRNSNGLAIVLKGSLVPPVPDTTIVP